MELHAFERLAVSEEEDMQMPVCPLQMTPAQVFPDVTPPGMAYVPYQLWSDSIYDAQTGIQQGTLFPVLDLPFSPSGGECS
jgi:hypothetical protein